MKSNAKADHRFEEVWANHPIKGVDAIITDHIKDYYKTDARYFFMMGLNACLDMVNDANLDPISVHKIIQSHLRFTGYGKQEETTSTT